MSTFLKIVVCTNVMLAGFLTNNLFAQCSTTKTTRNGVTTIQTHEQYEYLRTATQYYGLSIKTILITKAGSAGYKVIVNYTGSTLVNQPINLSFKLTDGYVLNSRMKFIKTHKNDNKKVSTQVYEFLLSEADINNLKETPLQQIDVVFGKQQTPVTIKIDDPTFMKSQISCLQKA